MRFCYCEPLSFGAHWLLHITPPKLTAAPWKAHRGPLIPPSQASANSIPTDPSRAPGSWEERGLTSHSSGNRVSEGPGPLHGAEFELGPRDSEEPPSSPPTIKGRKCHPGNHRQFRKTAVTQPRQNVLPETRVNSSGARNATGVLRCHRELCGRQEAYRTGIKGPESSRNRRTATPQCACE